MHLTEIGAYKTNLTDSAKDKYYRQSLVNGAFNFRVTNFFQYNVYHFLL